MVSEQYPVKAVAPVLIVGETPKRYRVQLEVDALLPPNRHLKAGDVVLVPKDAVQILPPSRRGRSRPWHPRLGACPCQPHGRGEDLHLSLMLLEGEQG